MRQAARPSCPPGPASASSCLGRAASGVAARPRPARGLAGGPPRPALAQVLRRNVQETLGGRVGLQPWVRSRKWAGFGPTAAQAQETQVQSPEKLVDVVVLTNGPGEVTGWVRPTVRALHERLNGEPGVRLRISVILAPCPHASNQEAALVQSYPEVDRCQGPESLYRTLLTGQSDFSDGFSKDGVVLFLGGDQLNAVILGFQLGYPTLIYAENAVMWPQFATRYLLREPTLLQLVPPKYQRVTGDLFLDAVNSGVSSDNSSLEHDDADSTAGALDTLLDAGADSKPKRLVALMPGSKPAKLSLGVPFFMAVGESIAQRMGEQVELVIPLAPTVTLEQLASYADAEANPYSRKFGWGSAKLIPPDDSASSSFARLQMPSGVTVHIWEESPAYKLFSRCDMVVTTVGTNTAELGALGVPMVVALPTNALEVFKGAGGLVGVLAGLIPGPVGDSITRAVNQGVLRALGPYLSWPNMWAKAEIVPELVGEVEPDEVAAVVLEYMNDNTKLLQMQQQLAQLQVGTSSVTDGQERSGTVEHSSSSGDRLPGKRVSAATAITQEVCLLLL